MTSVAKPATKAGKAAASAGDAEKRSASSAPSAAALPGRGGKPIVFDTNALLLALEHRTPLDDELLDLFGANEWIVPSTVVVELKTLAHKGEGSVARRAKMAVQLVAKRCKVEDSRLPGDDGLLEVARRLGAVVVTNDKTLQQECKASGLTVVVSREHGRRLAILGAASGPF